MSEKKQKGWTSEGAKNDEIEKKVFSLPTCVCAYSKSYKGKRTEDDCANKSSAQAVFASVYALPQTKIL